MNNDKEMRQRLAEALAVDWSDWPSEFHVLRRLAGRKGWKMPVNKALPAQAWIDYWRACQSYEGDPSSGRPVVPHRSASTAPAKEAP